MNYSGFSWPVWSWLRDPASPARPFGRPVPVPRRGGGAVVETFRAWQGALGWRATASSWNILGSHDSARIRTLVGGDAAVHRVAAGLQFTMPGVPMVFAGDEIGLEGVNGEDARRPMPWHRREEWDEQTLTTYADLARLRREHPALRRGGLRWAHVDADTIAYLREHPDQTVLVVARRAAGGAFTLPVGAGRHLFGSEPGGVDLVPGTDGVRGRGVDRVATRRLGDHRVAPGPTPRLALAPRARLGSRPWPCGSSPAGRTRPSCACPGTCPWRSGRTTSSYRSRAASRATWCASCGSAAASTPSRRPTTTSRSGSTGCCATSSGWGCRRSCRRASSPAARTATARTLPAALITHHLRFSLPYRSLFSRGMDAEHVPTLIDAIVVLLVRLHLAGFYWGDVSLSNVLFRRNAGELRRLPRRRRDRRAARGRRRPAAGVRHHRGLREHLRRADGPQRERRGPAPDRRLRDHRAPALALRGAVARADRPRGVRRRRDVAHRAPRRAAQRPRLRRRRARHRHRPGRRHDPHPAQGRRPRPPHRASCATSPA